MTVLSDVQVEQIRVLRLDPEDILIFQLPQKYSGEDVEAIKAELVYLLSPPLQAGQIVVIRGDVKISAVKPPAN